MTEKKRILYIITQSNMGGAQKYVFDLAIDLNKDNFDMTVAAGGDGELFKKLEIAGIKTIRLKWTAREVMNPFVDIIGLWEIYKLIKKERPDVIHLNSSKVGFSGSIAAKLAGVKVVYTVHGAVFEAAFSWLTRKLFLFLEKISARFKDKIICVSENDRRLWLKYKVAPESKLVTIHNGIPQIDFFSKEEAKQKLADTYNLDLQTLKDNTIVGWNGWFYPEKNLTSLIKAAGLILSLPERKNEKFIFLIFGNGTEEKKIKFLTREMGIENKIIFPGAVAFGARYLKAFDVFVLPSTKEGFPYAILEAMAADLPIVASNVGGIPEMIEDGVNGFIVKPNDYEALAEKILQILENPALAQKFSAASFEKVKEFSLEKTLKRTQDLYYNL